MKFKRKAIKKQTFDRANKIPVIKASICNGEQVAALKDKNSGRFEEVMVIRSERDLEEFMEMYGIVREEIKKEW